MSSVATRPERKSLLDAVVFDWAGTLADVGEHPSSVADWQPAAEVLGVGDPTMLAVRLHDVDERVRMRMAEEGRTARVEAIIKETAHLVGLDPSQEVLAAAIDTHLEACARRVVPDSMALDMLTDLRQAGYRTGLSADTTWPGSFCESLLARDGMHMQLDVRVYASDLGHCRPDVKAYKAMLAVLDIHDARRVVFVGDDPVLDLGTATRMGMRTILVAPHINESHQGGVDGGVDAVVSDLAEIPGWVAAWS